MHDVNFFEQLSTELPVFFTRREICAKLGGLIAPGTLANLDSIGQGCPGKKMVGGKIIYPRNEFLRWLESRIRNNITKV